jgi:hypothetical protein
VQAMMLRAEGMPAQWQRRVLRRRQRLERVERLRRTVVRHLVRREVDPEAAAGQQLRGRARLRNAHQRAATSTTTPLAASLVGSPVDSRTLSPRASACCASARCAAFTEKRMTLCAYSAPSDAAMRENSAEPCACAWAPSAHRDATWGLQS